MEEQKLLVRCPCMKLIEDYYPVIPFVVPLVPMLLLISVLWVHLGRMTSSIERQESLLEEILVDVRRR